MKNFALAALFWDIDGIFVDTEKLHFQAWQSLAQRFGQKFLLNEFLPFIGRGSGENIQAFLDLTGIKSSLDELNNLRRDFYENLRRQGISVIKKNVDLLKQFSREFPELIQVAVSSAKHSYIQENLKVARVESFFKNVISYENFPNLKRKPAPDLYLKALEIIDMEPQSVLAFEDSPAGIRAAQAASIFCVAIPNKLTQFCDCSFADLVINEKSSCDANRIIKKFNYPAKSLT